jgi:hypothetical protein
MAERLGLLCIDDEARVLQASRQQLRRALDVEIHLEVADCGEEGLEVMDELGEQGATSPFRGDAGASTSRGVPLSPRGDPSPPVDPTGRSDRARGVRPTLGPTLASSAARAGQSGAGSTHRTRRRDGGPRSSTLEPRGGRRAGETAACDALPWSSPVARPPG